MTTRRWLTPLLALVLLPTVGCVSKGRYELLETQLTATRSAMSARSLKSVQDIRDLEGSVTELEGEIARRQEQLDQLTADGEQRAVQLGELHQLTEQVQAELDDLRAQIPPPKKGAAPPEDPPAVAALDRRVAAALDALAQLEQEAESHARAVADVEQAFEAVVRSERASVLVRGRDVIVRIPVGQLYQEGWTTLSPRGEVLATDLGVALAGLPGRTVRIEGHTDVRPRHSTDFASNWERGFGSALTVMRALEQHSVPVDMVVGSWGGTRPLVEGDDDEANKANARVELVIDAHPDVLDTFGPTPPDAPSDAPEAEATPDEPERSLQKPADPAGGDSGKTLEAPAPE